MENHYIKDELAKKLRDAYTELRQRVKEEDSLVEINRIYGFCLGVASCLRVMKSKTPWPGQEVMTHLMTAGFGHLSKQKLKFFEFKEFK